MSKGRIVVVEDEMIVGKDIQTTLKSFGFEVPEVVSSGEAAIQAAFRCSPDLMLMDIMIKGGMDGVDAAEVIRHQFNIPVIYLTAYSDEETLRRAKLTESYGFISKPYNERELLVAIEFALYRHQLNDKRVEKIDWLQRVVKQWPDAFVVLDQEGKIEVISQGAETMLGLKEYELKGKSPEITELAKNGPAQREMKVHGHLGVQSYSVRDMKIITNERNLAVAQILFF